MNMNTTYQEAPLLSVMTSNGNSCHSWKESSQNPLKGQFVEARFKQNRQAGQTFDLCIPVTVSVMQHTQYQEPRNGSPTWNATIVSVIKFIRAFPVMTCQRSLSIWMDENNITAGYYVILCLFKSTCAEDRIKEYNKYTQSYSNNATKVFLINWYCSIPVCHWFARGNSVFSWTVWMKSTGG